MEFVGEELASWKAPIALVWLAVVFLAERLVPAAREPVAGAAIGGTARGKWFRVARNGALAVINAALSPLFVLPITFWAAGYALEWRPAWLAGWHGLLLDLLLLDLLIYWWHRANHRVGLLWRFHQVHHLDRFLDSTSALRFHVGEVVLSALARAGVIALLAIPFSSVLAFEALLLIATVFHHSNLRLPAALETGLARVIITPSLHWVHHHARQSDTDSTYGTLFSFWDRLFASSSATARRPGMPIGVEGEPDRPLLGLLAIPFRTRNEPQAK